MLANTYVLVMPLPSIKDASLTGTCAWMLVTVVPFHARAYGESGSLQRMQSAKEEYNGKR